MRRAFWFGLGVGSTVWARRAVNRKVRSYQPGPVATQVRRRAVAVGAEIRAAVSEGRAAMRDYQADAEAEVEAGVRRRSIRSVSSDSSAR